MTLLALERCQLCGRVVDDAGLCVVCWDAEADVKERRRAYDQRLSLERSFAGCTGPVGRKR